uniref:DNA endonuclease RBBP8 n=1 Tax=Lygus hesperus TaxID=30085 RepID=A0A0A9YJH2_LYGHE
MTTSENRWSQEALKEAWSQMFSYSFYQNHYENLDVQCILMLLEGGLSHVKKLGMAYSALKASEKELLVELEKKTSECWTLKDRMGKPCLKCESLEASLVDAERRAKEAQARMDSIANILRLGDKFEQSQGRKRNTAYDLVSQMILGTSPPSKKKKTDIMSPEKHEILACDTADVLAEKKSDANGIIPASVQLSPRKSTPPESLQTSKINVQKAPRSPVINVNFIPTSRSRPSLSRSCDPPPSTSKASNVKKNLSVDFGEKKHENEISPIKSLVFDLKKGPPPLDDTLKEYVKESTGKLLDNIWFSDDEDDVSKKENRVESKNEATLKLTEDSPATAGVIAETPCPKQKKADFWLLKEKRGAGEISKSSGRIMRQTKLELGFKRVQKKVDLAKLAAGKGGLLEDVKDDDDIIVASPDSQPSRMNLKKYLSQESEVNTTDFKPLASSTQMPRNDLPSESSKSSKAPVHEFDRLPAKVTDKEPDYAYVRGAVKKKADRAKLEGWDCTECAEYYSTMGKNLDPTEIKKRMNACSRHRDKFKPRLNETPPGFWNPLLPDTEEYKGYASICEK